MKAKSTILAAAADESVQVVQLIPASQLTRYPTNRIPTDDAIRTMASSIRENGVIQPILARPVPGENEAEPTLQLIFGETRWRACLSIDPTYPVPCRVRPLDDREAARIHAIENFQREGLTPSQEATEIRHMMDVGWNLDEVMQHLTRSKDWCYRRLAVLKLPDEGRAAVDDGRLAVEVAEKIAGLPEDLRADAVRACVSPTHSSDPLVKREALTMLHKKFIEPLKQAEEWNAKKKLLLRENPGAVFLEYKDACAAASYNSEYESATDLPSFHILSDAAQDDEMPVPTWKDLAEKHGATLYIGRDYKGDTTLYVLPEPIIEAEKALHRDKPGDCIFKMEEQAESLSTHNERRKIEAELEAKRRNEHRALLLQETLHIAQGILNPSQPKQKTLTRQRYLAKVGFQLFREELYGTGQWPEIIGVPAHEGEEEDDHRERAFDVLEVKLTAKSTANPLEMLGRIFVVSFIEGNPDSVVRNFPELVPLILADSALAQLLRQRNQEQNSRNDEDENDDDEKQDDAA